MANKQTEVSVKDFKRKLVSEIPDHNELTKLMQFLENDLYLFDTEKIPIYKYLELSGNDTFIDGVKKQKFIFDRTVFVPTEKKAFIIYNPKSDTTKYASLPNSVEDFRVVNEFLDKSNFSVDTTDRVILKNAPIDKVQKMFAKVNKWADELEMRKEKGLLFVYYSGHGESDGKSTFIVDPAGNVLDFTSMIGGSTGIGLHTNIFVVAILDCCRVRQKARSDFLPTVGQYYIYYAVEHGSAAISRSDVGPSEFTNDVMKLLNSTPKPIIPDLFSSLPFMDKGGSMCVNLAYKIRN